MHHHSEEEEECKHGLTPLTCSICKHGPTRTPPPIVEYTFNAKFEGTCAGCGFRVEVGDRISKWSNETYTHERCT